jgi:hypothetical protein
MRVRSFTLGLLRTGFDVGGGLALSRDYRCQTIDELVKLTLAWLDERGAFKIQGGMYQRLKRRAA